MTVSVWLSLVLVCMLGAMSPGPSLVVMVRHSLAGGRLHGIVAAWAHALGVGLYAVITLLGLAVILKESPMAFQIIAYTGAGYLAWLGIKSLQSKGGVAAKLESGEKTTLLEAARDGAMISVLNPKLALFFLALFSQFVAVGTDVFSRSVIVATPLVIDGLWYTLVALVLSSSRMLDTLKRRAVWIDKFCGIVLIGLAIRVVVTL
ncbi:lysine transporter LysE [Enterovibrio norvegicus]|uniref:LysE family translocator n=1 Tax=Enterovibrio norvegicus TaxID=188144 RepID=UPI000C83D0B6|nr:LysE family transporter [Enterovibrio norvegicus]MCC4798796.1 LysE family transporter [Enterovibrio norvegicus]PMI33411.1 lysine transporter LysE [Enterovibrio norvegicus]PMI33741.1 lysine transporter LysE [Enterovibrio norvegicus]PMN52187.1 lysine transporter LysE [Enterovibrio norvegicus]TKF14727.1 lysine transporter LysE [Enterovibrio norvegicus]